MSLVIHRESHCNHVASAIVEFVKHRFADRDGFFIETIELPTELGTLECGLYGPLCGDPQVTETEVRLAPRPGRDWISRLVNRPTRQTRQLSVIAGPHDGLPCVLYTCFGGPISPQEPDDPSLGNKLEVIKESQDFWAQHALVG